MATDHTGAGGPGRGRLSRHRRPRVQGSGLTGGGSGIVPAVQAPASLAAATPAAHSLMPYLIDPAHLHAAARLCMRRSSAPGADRMSWAAYRVGMRERLAALAGGLQAGTWSPGPLRLQPIATYDGKVITAAIPTVEDRIVHRAMRAAVDPILEAWAYADWVSGYRPRRNRLTAVRQATAHMVAGRAWIADLDVSDSSGGGTTNQLVDWLAEYVHDGTFLDRFRTVLNGLPSPLVPGTGLWPALFHLRLCQADRQLDGLCMVRFADNYTAFSATEPAACDAFDRIAAALAGIGLKPHPGKSRIRPPETANPEDLYLISG